MVLNSIKMCRWANIWSRHPMFRYLLEIQQSFQRHGPIRRPMVGGNLWSRVAKALLFWSMWSIQLISRGCWRLLPRDLREGWTPVKTESRSSKDRGGVRPLPLVREIRQRAQPQRGRLQWLSYACRTTPWPLGMTGSHSDGLQAKGSLFLREPRM